jgi:endonuclease/exonuclease/phosphatase family metal-dependent hydrolase
MRVVTYNVHKCRGLDGRIRPERIVRILREIDADIIALQEIVGGVDGSPQEDQAAFIAGALGFSSCLGENRRLNGRAYGNLVLSRYPLHAVSNYDITRNGREQRGCLRVDLEMGGDFMLHVFNVHLGTGFVERRDQGRKLVTSEILNNRRLHGARIVLGDFNEWTRGLATRLLTAQLESVDIQKYGRRSRTYPAILPLLHLDHVYFDPILKVESVALHRSRAALIASDHLPLVADFRIPTVH